MLGHLDNDGVAGKEGRRDGIEHVVERIVPWNDGADEPSREELDPCALVHCHPARAAHLWLESSLAGAGKPVDLLEGGQHLSEPGINHGLTSVAGGDAADGLSMLEYAPPDDAHQLCALSERGFGPNLLRLTCPLGGRLHVSVTEHCYGAEEGACGRIVARD
eukprot:scaffold175063_cov27-Tisochrysis_lutea.AAC.1